jgi:hypothetical protein
MIKLNDISSSKRHQESSNELVNKMRTELNNKIINTKRIEELLAAHVPNECSDQESGDSD